MTKSTDKASTRAKGNRAAKAMPGPISGELVTVANAIPTAVPGAGFLSKTRLKKAGGSLVVTVPASARNLLQLFEGQEMAVSVVGSAVVMEPLPAAKPMRVRKPKYTLDQLVLGMDPDATLADEERVWMDAPPAGREIW